MRRLLLEEIFNKTLAFIEQMPKTIRKQYGQFFTTIHTARFMASLFDVPENKDSIRVLDAGAGSGILSASFVEAMRKNGFTGTMNLTCYETDSTILPLLESNLELVSEEYNIDFNIVADNYLTSQTFESNTLFYDDGAKFDYVIGNPPYKKISKEAEEAKHMPSICYGAPNLYFLFWAMGIHNLKQGCELVYIIPRSWTSGAYFEKFRNYLYSTCIIETIHLFGSRDKVFKGESVLQETIIIKTRKSSDKPKAITVSFSDTCDFTESVSNSIPYNTIVGSNGYVFLVTSKHEVDVMNSVSRFSSTLIANGLKMKTGIIVDFRSQEVLRNEQGANTYPLFYSQHLRNGIVSWPIGKENEYICTNKIGYLQENTYYLFVKRFTAKEERRRLQCGIFIPDEYPDYKYISTDNKLNYIKCDTIEEAYGLYVLFNSTLYDMYYRILNGSTQVNSTEINNMPIPSRDIIVSMGKELLGKSLTETNCNIIINKWIK